MSHAVLLIGLASKWEFAKSFPDNSNLALYLACVSMDHKAFLRNS